MDRSLVMILIIFITSCSGISVPTQPRIGAVSPSPYPAIQSPTLPFSPTGPATPINTQLANNTEIPTLLPVELLTPTLGQIPGIQINLSACNTSLDLIHGMGEVTNAYPLVKNVSSTDLNSVCATLSANDEERMHPDKTSCVDLLPAGFQITMKLTVDTGFQVDTFIQVAITTQEKVTASIIAPSCLAIGFPGWVPANIGVIEPIQ
jgi:hypothetical protein